MSQPSWTLLGLLKWTETYLQSKGIDSPGLEARVLLAHALGCRQIELYTRSEEIADEAARVRFRELIQRRVAGCPVAYLVGTKEFFKLALEVTPAVLIPRPETEFLVMECLRLLPKDRSATVLDLGTGSGNIALSIAQQRPLARLTAVDISADALAVARRNAERHQLLERVRFLEGDLYEPIPPGERFEFILSNPPYVESDALAGLEQDVRDHEPALALDGGLDGLAVYRRIVARADQFLGPGGHLILEIGATQEAAVRELIERQGGFGLGKTIADGAKLPRVIVARAPV